METKNLTKINQKEEKLEGLLEKIADSYKFNNILARGVMTGIFTAFGATIGFAFVIFVLGIFISRIKTIPIVQSIFQEFKIDKLINKQLEYLELESIKDETPLSFYK